MGLGLEDVSHSQVGPRSTPKVYIEPQRGKVLVDCVINPNRNTRRIMCSPSTCFSAVAADLEATVAVPATVVSLSDIDGSVRQVGPLSFTEPLSAFGLKADDRITVEIHLRRPPRNKIFAARTGQFTESTIKTKDKIRRKKNKPSNSSGENAGTDQETSRAIEDANERPGRHPRAGGADMLSTASDRCLERASCFKVDKESSTKEMSEELDANPSTTPFLKAVSQWKAFSADSLDPIVIEPEESSRATHSTQTKEETASRRSTRFHTETQTRFWETSGIQLTREAAVQMQKRGLFIANTSDRVLEPSGAYEDADTLDKKKFEKSIVIQASMRRILAQKKARALRRAKEEQEAVLAARATTAKEERELFKRREEARCLRPETYDDFRTLYAGVETWRQQEAERIKHLYMKSEHRQRAFKELLQTETEILKHIDELKLKTKRNNKQIKICHVLNLLAQPLEWLSASTGNIITVYTPETMRAGELRDLYIELSRDDLPPRNRLDSLQYIRQRVAEAASGWEAPFLTSEFSELIEREIDLLQRGRTSNQKLRGLRQRLTHAFWYLIQTPQFNPQAARFLRSTGINLLVP